MKQCVVIKKKDGKYRWDTDPGQHPADCCIMAVHLGQTVMLQHLNELKHGGMISAEELLAIHYFDYGDGEDEHLKIIKKLGKRLDINILVRPGSG